ncbi:MULTISPECIES: quinone oxidoreductase family protein [Pontibacillus]|uniref:Zinc-binding dehydrogenase n=1 Tax=Pontibacillus chungwhensis TaxID=265426 RepID=A0ABY8V414_9BACI|nr:zinc-binding dehydrogenase [Pontibacillus chungwhensis]MCD5323437.1 zinc-binding dehydrogenase [Pontibacillus sp. HN14]WIG00209.1 zinc-binding dehydrogenase [Pontibacillus chungwhensis]
MKKIEVRRFGGPEVMCVVEADLPEINEDEVLIKVNKASVNFADIKKRKGSGTQGVFPFTPGLDAMGVVVEKGQNVSKIEIGQRVIAFPKEGSYAEYVVASETLTYKVPNRLNDETAAACPTVGILAYKLLHDIARLRLGERVLIHAAAGGVGTTAIGLAKQMGARTIVGVVGHKDKLEIAYQAGADHVFLNDRFSEEVITRMGGVDVVLDSVGGKVSKESLNCLAHYGRLVQFGNAGGHTGQFQTSQLHKSCRSILGYSLGTTRQERPETIRGAAHEVLRLLETKQLHIPVSKQYSLEEIRDAHAWVESRRSIGKLVINVNR